jgi:hypothetical protein
MDSEIFNFDNIEMAVIEQSLNKRSDNLSGIYVEKFNMKRVSERKKMTGLYGGSPRESPKKEVPEMTPMEKEKELHKKYEETLDMETIANKTGCKQLDSVR